MFTEFKSVLSQIPLQGAGFQSTCFLSPWAQSSETSLHQKSWIIYHKSEKNTLSNFCNLLQSRNYHEARSYLVCKQEAFQSLSKTFVQSVNLMQLLQDVFNMFSSSSWTTMLIKWGSNLSFCSCTIWRLHFCICKATIFLQ